LKTFIFNILILYFICFLDTRANESIYTVKDNKIFLQNDRNVLELRENARNIAFSKAFNILTKKILDSAEIRKIDRLGEFDISGLIRDFKIVEEKVTDINYSANILVNFNPDSILLFFENNGIKSQVLVSEQYVIFPVFKKFNTLYLWENDNYWYDFLFDEYDELGLLKLFFPKKNHINKLRISGDKVLSEDIESIQNFLNTYEKKKAIIIFLEENFSLNLNKLESSVSAKVFSDGKLETIRLFQKDMYKENSEQSNAKLISKTIMNELQGWWKNQIALMDFGSRGEFIFYLKINPKDLKQSLIIENKMIDVLGNEGFQLFEFDNNQIIYKITSNYSTKQLNALLESENLRLVDSPSEENYFLLQQF
tara:strand:+ start:506 stop:1606 length:1101 start_codon:yes stop_codon:yes gene_type:complete